MKNLIKVLNEFFLPTIEIDQDKKEIKVIDEGIFGRNILESYYILKGYRIINEQEF